MAVRELTPDYRVREPTLVDANQNTNGLKMNYQNVGVENNEEVNSTAAIKK